MRDAPSECIDMKCSEGCAREAAPVTLAFGPIGSTFTVDNLVVPWKAGSGTRMSNAAKGVTLFPCPVDREKV